jgi:two-component system chemotaxis response regulator CheY
MTKILLLVSDSRVSRMMIKTVILQVHPDWQVLEAGDGEAALELTRNQTFDVAILQLTTSKSDGLELAEKLMIKHPQAEYALVIDDTQNGVRENAKKFGLGLIEQPVTEKKIETFLADC